MRRILPAALAVASLAGAAAADGRETAYRNPTVGHVLALQLAGMHRAAVTRGLVYRRVGRSALLLDVYRPRGGGARLLPAVLVGGPPGFGRTSGQKVGWSQAIAASGLAAVAFDHRSDAYGATPGLPSSDVAAALRYIRAHGRRLGLDGSRVCTLGFSLGTAPWHLWAAMKGPNPAVRCNVALYAPLDLSEPGLPVARRFATEYSAITYLRRDGARIAPLFVAKAGHESNPGINPSIDRFAVEAAERGAPVRVVTHATGGHGFDLVRGARSRAIIREALAFLREHLTARSPAAVPAAKRRPLRFTHRCVTRAERRRVVRFAAADGTRLVGVTFGAGARGVVLAHQGGGAPEGLCAWVPYARRLAGAGYRVLVFDHRRFGDSESPRRDRNVTRVDLDALAGVRELRRRGVTSVVLAGASLGGSAVVAAGAAARPPVQGVVSLSAPRLFGRVNTLAAAARLTVPVLYVAAEEDEPFPSDGRQLFAATTSVDKRIEIFPGSDHGAPMLRDAAVRQLVDGWIAAHSTAGS